VKYEINFNCCFCLESHKQTIDLPNGWASRYSGIEDEHGFCPRHSEVAKFADSQCPGCVGSWGDCDLWRSFAFGHQRDISENDLSMIEEGICPKRTNGTLYVNGGSVEHVDLSDRATPESGKATADAIRKYMKRYPAEQDGSV